MCLWGESSRRWRREYEGPFVHGRHARAGKEVDEVLSGMKELWEFLNSCYLWSRE